MLYKISSRFLALFSGQNSERKMLKEGEREREKERERGARTSTLQRPKEQYKSAL